MTTRLVHVLQGTPVIWNSAGTDELLTATSLLTATGRQGALHDFGTSSRPRRYSWRARMVPGGTQVVGETVNIYLKTSDGTNPDNDDGTGDIAVSDEDKLLNLMVLGGIMVDEAAASVMVASGHLDLEHQHACPVFWNATANTLSATATDFVFTMIPMPDQIQSEV